MNHKQIILFLMLILLPTLLLPGSSSAASTQGQFAVKLAENLGLGKMDQDKAIQLLSSLSIRPGILPTTTKWEKDKPATDKFVAYIQASIQLILKKVADELDVPAPPTLDLQIVELPPAPQSITFPKGNISDKPPGHSPSSHRPPAIPENIPPNPPLPSK